MKLVRPGSSSHIDYGTVAAPVFAGEISRLNLHFLNGFNAGNNARLSFIESMGVHRPVENIIIPAKAVSIDSDGWRIGEFVRHILTWNICSPRIKAWQEKDVADGNRKLSNLRFMQCV